MRKTAAAHFLASHRSTGSIAAAPLDPDFALEGSASRLTGFKLPDFGILPVKQCEVSHTQSLLEICLLKVLCIAYQAGLSNITRSSSIKL